MNIVEICIASDQGHQLLVKNVESIFAAGAQRIELCSAMADEGLTPSIESIAIARRAMAGHKGLMVMIRPRAGDFCYNAEELELMAEQISQAADAGANGVVFGVLNKDQPTLNIAAIRQLKEIAKELTLEVGIHRAFDAVNDQTLALQQLIDLGVDRVLTSGGSWGDNSSAPDNINNLAVLAQLARQQIELVIAGGVSAENASNLLKPLSDQHALLSLHAHSSVLAGQVVDPIRVSGLVQSS